MRHRLPSSTRWAAASSGCSTSSDHDGAGYAVAVTSALEPLALPVSDRDLADLADLLVDVVDGGASTSFLPPLAAERAAVWWRDAVASPHPAAVTLVARD